ncbi:MAG TPA: 4-alpha-glucanotransferase [Epulopiscium sp.]|nr:4-alpha-glucanotransferase [Candidatus Epulonipiscium sp.]
MIDTRACGILLHPTSLPSPYGIGDLGQGAYDFIDFLEASGQTYWQILPLESVGAGNSPYASCSAFAKNLLLISPQKLVEAGLLTSDDLENPPPFNAHKVDYPPVKSYKDYLFQKVFINFSKLSGDTLTAFNSFSSKNSFWLEDYSLYIAIKEYYQNLRLDIQEDHDDVIQRLKTIHHEDLINECYNGGSWITWPTPLKNREAHALRKIKIELKDSIHYHKILQFIFHTQWAEVKSYANDKGIKIIGDMPIFVSYDSADVWSQPELFDLNKDGFPTEVAGVPPDYFCADGQLWGNPLYDWDFHDKTDYKWWLLRLRNMLQYTDHVRIDHFRGLESYWAIPVESKTAKSGKWKKGPGHKFFEAFILELGELPIIAEDLGSLTEEVNILRDTFHLAGMSIIQFAFENNNTNPYLQHNCKVNSVIYTGTHDNDTLLGWYEKCDSNVRDQVRSYINNNDDDIVWKLIRLAYACVCNTAIIPIQDVQQLGSEARMNVPGVASGNWEWRYTQDMINTDMILGLNYLRNLYGR